ncbi:MAG: hypothetical protein RBT66_07040 [bacterium]|jgi:hypothetical protein|nr:hypothetical protein [bacterium]
MGQSGYGMTLAGGTTGSLSGVESVTIGGLELDFDEIATVADTNRIVENLPTKVREQPMEVTLKWNKTVYNACRTALLAQTDEEWTLTDAGSSTHIGNGFVRSVGSVNLDTDGHQRYTVSIQPKTSWAFSA